MSAFLCNPEHIGALAVYLNHHLSDFTPGDLAEELAKANIKSVACRYPSDKDGHRPGPSGIKDAELVSESMAWARHYHQTGLPMSSDGISNMFRCFNYQSCEAPDWEGSLLASLVTDGFVHAKNHRIDGQDVAWEWGEEGSLAELLKCFLEELS